MEEKQDDECHIINLFIALEDRLGLLRIIV